MAAARADAAATAGLQARLQRELDDAERVRASRADAAPAAAGSRKPAAQAAAALEVLRSADTVYGVRWRSLALGGQGVDAAAASSSVTGPAAMDIDRAFAAAAQDPKLRVAGFRAEGEYRSLTRLMELIDALQARGVAITGMRLEDETVQLSGQVIARGA